MVESSRVRIGDAERDDAVSLLGDHLAAGRVDYEEFQQRTGAVLAARTRGELDAVFDDLPGRRPGNADTAPPGRGGLVPVRGVGPWWPQQAALGGWWPAVVIAVAVAAVCVAAALCVAGGGAFMPFLVMGMWGFGHRGRGGGRRNHRR